MRVKVKEQIPFFHILEEITQLYISSNLIGFNGAILHDWNKIVVRLCKPSSEMCMCVRVGCKQWLGPWCSPLSADMGGCRFSTMRPNSLYFVINMQNWSINFMWQESNLMKLLLMMCNEKAYMLALFFSYCGLAVWEDNVNIFLEMNMNTYIGFLLAFRGWAR